MSVQHQKVDFDRYAEEYRALLEEQNTMFGGSRAYFSKYKIDILRRLFIKPVKSILDFGAGIGLSLPFILESFPEARTYATDISTGSLAHISAKYPDVTVVSDEAASDRRYDLILLITVLHHVEPRLRDGLLRRLAAMLAPGGSLCIFEHNPFNPLTRRMVSTCAFDSDAILLTRQESIGLLRNSGGLSITHAAYTLFMPHTLRGLRFIEPALGWLPLGGQYYAIGESR